MRLDRSRLRRLILQEMTSAMEYAPRGEDSGTLVRPPERSKFSTGTGPLGRQEMKISPEQLRLQQQRYRSNFLPAEEVNPEFVRLVDEASDAIYELAEFIGGTGIRPEDFPKFYEAWHPWESVMSKLRNQYGNKVDVELNSMRMNPDKIPVFE